LSEGEGGRLRWKVGRKRGCSVAGFSFAVSFVLLHGEISGA
jgi:hypothetical protein